MMNKDKNITLVEDLNKIGISLSKEHEISKVYDLILSTAMKYTNADAGTLYKFKSDKLEFKVIKNLSLNLDLSGKKIKWPPLRLYDENGKKIVSSTPTYVYHTKETIKINDIYTQKNFDPSKTKEIDKNNNYRTKSSIIFPLMNHESDIIGIIQLINAQDEKNNIIPFTEEHLSLFESLGSQVSILLSNKNLISQLERMIFSLMKAVANAIDKKSKWTGHHIQNVANFTIMLAKKINNANSGFFKDKKFSLTELKEIKLSALVHDIGKIATPQHILDKKFKLDFENIRIDLIRARFEIAINDLKRDVELFKLQNKNIDSLKEEIQRLEDDFQLIWKLNDQKIMLDDKVKKSLERILKYRRKIFNKESFLITNDEFINLSISRGTLNDKEREVITNHAQISKDILEKVPFPQKYKNIPLYAYSHHEKLNGKGYPCHLTEKDLPLQSRIIAFADIFEALTAHDRIYKKPNSIQKSLEILAFLVKENSLDKNLLDLILDSKVYQEYAEKFLLKSQITEIDTNKIKRIYEKDIK